MTNPTQPQQKKSVFTSRAIKIALFIALAFVVYGTYESFMAGYRDGKAEKQKQARMKAAADSTQNKTLQTSDTTNIK